MSESLQSSSLRHIQNIHNQIQQDILQNDAQIKLISNKIIKNDYDRTLLSRLEEHADYLNKKKDQLQAISQNHRNLQAKAMEQEMHQKRMRKNIGSQYLLASQEKRLIKQQQRRKMLQNQRKIQQFNQKSLESDYLLKKREIEDYKKVAQQQINLKMKSKEKQKEQLQKQKEQYSFQFSLNNQKASNKDSILQQYCKSFMQEQKKMPISYKLKGGVNEVSKSLNQSREYQSKYNFDQQLGKKIENQEKGVLRSYLQNQMSQKIRRKSYQQSQFINQQIHTSRLLANSIEGEQAQKMKKKQEQRRYDEQLKTYDRMRSYSSSEGIPTLTKSHNPITNPISFKIGITNPYILRQFQQAKQKYLGDPHLKLRNLAMIGNSSLLKQ